MTAAEVLAQARIHLADTVVTYRWPEAELLGYVNAGMRDIRKQRPDAAERVEKNINFADLET